MKKIRLLFIMIICIMLLASCEKNEIEAPPSESEEQMITEESLSDQLDAVIGDMDSEAEDEAQEPQPEYDEDGYEIVEETVKTIDVVNVRKEPSTDSEIVISLEADVELVRVGKKDEWSKVKLNDQICYVATEFLLSLELDNDNSSEFKKLDKVIAIDAGHQKTSDNDTEYIGPNTQETKPKMTSGTTGSISGMSEYQLTISVAQELRSVLEERGYTVIMTREKNDVNISNKERALLAQDASVLISIHADDDSNKEKSGIYAICPSKDNADVPFYADSHAVATKILNKMQEKSGAQNQGILENDKLAIINWSKIPTVIIELGYMSNDKDDKNMADDIYRAKLIQGIADGLDQHFE